MGAYIMDHFVDRERTKALMVMARAYVFFTSYQWRLGLDSESVHFPPCGCPLCRYHQLPVTFIRDELAFDNVSQTINFLTSHRAAFFQNPNAHEEQRIFDCKAAQLTLNQVFDEKYRKATIKGAI
jgi:hypothetical protein